MAELRERDKYLPDNQADWGEYLKRKNKETEALDRRQGELRAENNLLEVKLGSY